MKEYKMIEVYKNDAEQTMNVMATQGWELVSVSYWEFFGRTLLLNFTRERK